MQQNQESTKGYSRWKVTATYMEDPIAFKQHIQAAYVDLFSMYDSDMNCKLAKDEY